MHSSQPPAIVHGLKLVTRNEADFQSAVNEVVNPWIG
jgi:hypothetical protein